MKFALCIAVLVALNACSKAQSPLLVTDLDVQRALPGTSMGRAYLAIQNTTDATVTITRVTSPDFGHVAMHESVIDDGIARMRSLESLTIAAGQTVRLEAGGKHLMLHDALSADDTVEFVFYAGDAPILSVAAKTAERSQ